MKIQYRILCLVAIVSATHAVMPIKVNNDEQVRNEMNALIVKINHDIGVDVLNMEEADKNAAKLKALEEKAQSPKLKAEIRANANNMEHAIKFHKKHYHMSILEKNKNK